MHLHCTCSGEPGIQSVLQTISKELQQSTLGRSELLSLYIKGRRLTMPRKRPEDFKKGINWGKVLNHFRLGRPYWPYWKIIGKRLVYTTLAAGAVWLYDETSPLGWWTLKPRPKEERELAHLYERREFPYPGDKEAMEEFVAKGGMIGTSIGPKGTIENDKDSLDIQKAIENQRFEQEANKLWSRMKSEVLSELQEKGFDFE